MPYAYNIHAMYSHIITPTSISFKSFVRSFALVFAVCGALSLGSCSSSKHTAKPTTTQRPSKPATVKDIDIASMSKVEKSLVKEATAWLGTPYKYGGNTRSGVDCSGFVYHVFRNSLDINLPRNSGKQHDYCRKISKKDLSTGDLVFFATTRGSKKVSHVGLYVGDGKMIHASTSRGVVCQNLSDDYYTRTFVGAGRIDSFASINKSKKSKPSKSEKSDGKPRTPKSEATRPVESAPALVPSVHIDEIDKVLQPEPTPEVTPVPEVAPTSVVEPQPVVTEPVSSPEPSSEPTSASAPVSSPEPLTPVKITEPAHEPAPTMAADGEAEDSRSSVLRNLPDLQ